MNAYQTYRKQQQTVGTTRIDLLLSLFDGAIQRMAQAEEFLRTGNPNAAVTALSKAQLIVSELAAGVRTDVDQTNGPNLLRLYEFVVHQISLSTLESVSRSRKIMQTLHEGFVAIRTEGIELERRGEMVSSDSLRVVLATA
jgi:flagellar secretion chaperone FliS